MTEQEFRDKIAKIIENDHCIRADYSDCEGCEYKNCFSCKPYRLADALIAAGIGDLKEHRIFAGKDGSIKQLYSGEEVEKIVKEREEYKHRAEVAENELKLYKLAVKIWQERYSDIRCFNFNIALKQAEEELAEEGKDG